MRIKNFRADDMRQALALVKQELGDDAVILDTRPVRESSVPGPQIQGAGRGDGRGGRAP